MLFNKKISESSEEDEVLNPVYFSRAAKQKLEIDIFEENIKSITIPDSTTHINSPHSSMFLKNCNSRTVKPKKNFLQSSMVVTDDGSLSKQDTMSSTENITIDNSKCTNKPRQKKKVIQILTIDLDASFSLQSKVTPKAPLSRPPVLRINIEPDS